MVDAQKVTGKKPVREHRGKTAKQATKPVDVSPNEPYKMRITSGGSIASYVDFAISFLNDDPHTPLVLHTLPPPPSTTTQEYNEASPSTPSAKYPTTLLSCTTNIPRLITVVEIIKRTYLEALCSAKHERNPKIKGKEKMRMSKGIWQYTESALYHPSAQMDGGGEGEGNSLERVLGGKSRPKMIHHPYLTVTLSTVPLGLEERRNVNVQHVLVKSRNRRKKGRGKEDDAGDEAEAEFGEEMEETGNVNGIRKKSVVHGSTKDDAQGMTEEGNGKSGKGLKRSSDGEEQQNKIGKKRKIDGEKK
ncbi:hypothetical protein I302_105712 [Kwoniella bestiolae CBS 10118]|uniref:Uncharacterized protein n=1 Tax=Kwoniella bestiolae CBS 10118 TaxID=1296100 RepID=A0A1B9G1X0_9TREE|nr:hypothetical protein I302_04832 [Kwoniella bestiolae CBS 10118]OCF25022.1 hypothetical protein I302_04832 [Kwoniella bestiolae CBS 10118]